MEQPDINNTPRGGGGDSELRLNCYICGWSVEAVTRDAVGNIFLGIPYLKEHGLQQHNIIEDDELDKYGA
jgi:hypothetical protein